MKYFILYLIIINIITFFLYGLDKRLAIQHERRIKEATLLLSFPLLGGTIGAMAGMVIFHHKTKKAYFKIGLTIILILQIVLCIYIKLKGFN
ncbi:MAG: DUF1294 domain-containing protein [Holdemanella sp.]|nr:DUF1294 domain-containing protein [Holdemanella sp.]